MIYQNLLRCSLTLTVGAIACAAMQRSSPQIASQAATVSAARADRNVITRLEIRPTETPSAYDVVSRLRPYWLFAHGGSAHGQQHDEAPHVLVGEVWFGTAASLRDIAAETVEELRYLNPADATTRFGTGHTTGVIVVVLRHS